MSSIKMLIKKLDSECHKSLEASTVLCMRYTHHHIEPEHWLFSLLENEESLFYLILNYLNIDIDALKIDTLSSLEKLKKGNDKTPTLSNSLIEWINQAWLLTSLNYNETEVDSASLLDSLTQNRTLQQIINSITEKLNDLDQHNIKKIKYEVQKQNNTYSIQPKNSRKTASNKALTQFTINLNQQAKAGKIDEVIGRETEISQMIDILSRRRQNNVMLTGEPGVGKTAIVEGLALKIIKGDVPDKLKNTVIHTLDMALLQAGASIKGEFENRLHNLISEIKQSSQPIILFIDEAHSLIGAGGSSGQNDAANLLKPALARGELRSIAATTWAEYKRYFEKDAALTRRFQVVKVAEPDSTTTINMLRSLSHSLEKHHGIKILDNAIIEATHLSQRYITARQLPDKAISALDTACARASSKLNTKPNTIETKEKRLIQFQLEIEQLKNEKKWGQTHHQKIKELKSIINQLKIDIKKLKKQWEDETKICKKIINIAEKNSNKNKSNIQSISKLTEKLNRLQQKQAFASPYVTAESIADVIADWTGIPIKRLIKNEAQKLLQLENNLQQKIIGQSEAIKAISAKIKINAAKLSNPNKPLGVFLLTGPSGVGKTETAAILAETLFGKKEQMTVINMSEFKEEHKISLLSGSPPGYIGYGEGGILTEAVRRQPYSLILLDEMEKAHPSIQEAFYQIFDKGIMRDSQGEDIDFKNTLIIMTSNACSESIEKASQENPKINLKELYQSIEAELLHLFKPAFIGRTSVIPYQSLSVGSIKKIADAKLKQIQQQIKAQQKIDLRWDNSVIEYLVQQCHNPALGARQIDNSIQQYLLPSLSEYFLSNIIDENNTSIISMQVKKNGDFHYQYHANICPNINKKGKLREQTC